MSLARKRALLWDPVQLVRSADYREQRRKHEVEWISFLYHTGLIDRDQSQKALDRLGRFFRGLERKLN